MHFDKMLDLAEERALAKGTSVFYEMEKIPGYSGDLKNYHATLSAAVGEGLVSMDVSGSPNATEFAREQIKKESNARVAGSFYSDQRGYFSLRGFFGERKPRTKELLEELDVYGLNQPSTLRKIAAGAAVGIFAAAAGAAMLADHDAEAQTTPNMEKIVEESSIEAMKISPDGTKLAYGVGGVLKEINLRTSNVTTIDTNNYEGFVNYMFSYSDSGNLVYTDIENQTSSKLKIITPTGTRTLVSSEEGILKFPSYTGSTLVYLVSFNPSLSDEPEKLFLKQGSGDSVILASSQGVGNVKTNKDGSKIGFMDGAIFKIADLDGSNQTISEGARQYSYDFGNGKIAWAETRREFFLSDTDISFYISDEDVISNKKVGEFSVSEFSTTFLNDVEWASSSKISYVYKGSIFSRGISEYSSSSILVDDESLYIKDHEWVGNKLFFLASTIGSYEGPNYIYMIDSKIPAGGVTPSLDKIPPTILSVKKEFGSGGFLNVDAEIADNVGVNSAYVIFNTEERQPLLKHVQSGKEIYSGTFKISDSDKSFKVYADDKAGNVGSSSSIFLRATPEPDNEISSSSADRFSFVPYLAIGLAGAGAAGAGVYFFRKRQRENKRFATMYDSPVISAPSYPPPQPASFTPSTPAQPQPKNRPPPVPYNYRRESAALVVSQPPPANFSNHHGPPRIVSQTAAAPAPSPAPLIRSISPPQPIMQPPVPAPRIVQMPIRFEAVDDFAEFYGVRPQEGKNGFFILAKSDDIPQIKEDFQRFQRKKFGW